MISAIHTTTWIIIKNVTMKDWFLLSKVDGFVKSRNLLFWVIPAQVGISLLQHVMDSRFRGSDGLRDFLQD